MIFKWKIIWRCASQQFFFSIQTLLVKEDFHSHPSTMAKATEATTNNNKTLKVETDDVVNNYQIIFRLKTTHKLSFLLGLWFGYFILRQQIFMDTSAWMMTKIRGLYLIMHSRFKNTFKLNFLIPDVQYYAGHKE